MALEWPSGGAGAFCLKARMRADASCPRLAASCFLYSCAVARWRQREELVEWRGAASGASAQQGTASGHGDGARGAVLEWVWACAHLGWGCALLRLVLLVLGFHGYLVASGVEIAGAAVGDETVKLRGQRGGDRRWANLQISCEWVQQAAGLPSPFRSSCLGQQTWMGSGECCWSLGASR